MKDYIISLKKTKFSSYRFILPKEWLKNILNDKNERTIINNSFLNTKKNKLKKNLDKEKIVIIVYEIMEKIINLDYIIDYLILIEYYSKKNLYDFDDVYILEPSMFYQIELNYEQIILDKSYFEPKNSKIDDNANLSESINILLKGKDDTYIDDFNKKNNKSKKREAKNNKNPEDKNDENFDEFYPNENIHNNSYNFKNKDVDNLMILSHKSNKSPKKDNKDSKNKKEKNDEEDEHEYDINEKEEDKKEEHKIYFFNKYQITINLKDFKKETIEPIGLINPSIYCFMICILQSLLSIPELNYFFLSKIYLLSNKKESSEDDNSNNDYIICNSFQNFIKQYLLSKKPHMQISRNLFRICNRLLGGMHMHDSQEFLVCFLEALQSELNPSIANEKKKKKNENLNYIEKWIEYRTKNNSFIDAMFTGLMRSTVECKKCKHNSTTYDPFIDLNISINKYKDLEKCLKQFFEYEKIDCEYKCDNCKNISKVSTIKFLIIFFRLLKN